MITCKLNSRGIWLDGNLVRENSSETLDWKKELYDNLSLDYPKFHKMDALAKMAFLSLHFIQDKVDFGKYKDDEIAMLFANSGSSISTDIKFESSYKDKGSPSPSLFVYTLPNILTGELAIFKKWYGENIFFIQEKFDAEFFLEQINFYFSGHSTACLSGWVDAKENLEECFLFFVAADEQVNADELQSHYNR